MKDTHTRFRHESIQDSASIQEILDALTRGLGRGQLELEDDEGKLELTPQGLLHLKVTATREDMGNRLSIRISWRDDDAMADSKPLKVK